MVVCRSAGVRRLRIQESANLPHRCRVGCVAPAVDGRCARGIPRSRVDAVLDIVGLGDAARKRAGSFSLGMGQRLGIASALLGDPEVLILDEPVNGLDPDGVLWIRNLMRTLAAEGRTVFVSSHLMSEMAVTAEHLIVIGRGRLLVDMSVDDFIDRAGTSSVRVRSPRATELYQLLSGPGVTVTSIERGVVEITGLTAEAVGDRALAAGIPLHELSHRQPSLEQAFMDLTSDVVEYQAVSQPAHITGATR